MQCLECASNSIEEYAYAEGSHAYPGYSCLDCGYSWNQPHEKISLSDQVDAIRALDRIDHYDDDDDDD